MDQKSFDLLVLAIFLCVGAYSLFSVLRLKQTDGQYENRLLYPASFLKKDCKDLAGYIAFMTPRVTIFGILCVLMAAAELVRSYVLENQKLVIDIIVFVVEVLVVVYLAHGYSVAGKRFWDAPSRR